MDRHNRYAMLARRQSWNFRPASYWLCGHQLAVRKRGMESIEPCMII